MKTHGHLNQDSQFRDRDSNVLPTESIIVRKKNESRMPILNILHRFDKSCAVSQHGTSPASYSADRSFESRSKASYRTAASLVL